MIKISKQHWEINNTQKLSELTENPKLLWSYLKSLRGAIKSKTPNVISPQQWVKSFQNCLYSKSERADISMAYHEILIFTIFRIPTF